MLDSRTIRGLESSHGYTTTQCPEVVRSDCGHVTPDPIESGCFIGHDSSPCFVSDLLRD